jgi:hypothetical protein
MDSEIDRSGKNVADQKAPYAAPCVTGLSPEVHGALGKLTPALRQGVLDVVKRKNS